MEYDQQTMMSTISIFFSSLFQGCPGRVRPTFCNNVQAEFNQIQLGHCPGTFHFVPPRGRRPPRLRQPRSALRHGQVGLRLPLLRLPAAA